MLVASPVLALEPMQWQAKLRSVCGHFESRTDHEQVLGNIELLHKGQADFALVQHNVRQIVRRYRDISQDGEAYYFLIIQLAGQAELEQGKSRAHLSQVGDMALIDSLQPCTFSYNPDIGSRQLSLHLPQQVLQQHNPHLHIDPATLISATSDYGQLINAHLKLLLNSQDQTLTQVHLSKSLIELLCAQFTRAPDAEQTLYEGKVLQHLMQLIHQHANDEYFNVQRLADMSGLSLRTIQRVFAEAGLQCADMIQTVRLKRFTQALHQAKQCGTKVQIATLAYQFGFSDISTLNRLFKKYYAMTPSTYYQQVT
jgi:AraC-like DNA-binding protein